MLIAYMYQILQNIKSIDTKKLKELNASFKLPRDLFTYNGKLRINYLMIEFEEGDYERYMLMFKNIGDVILEGYFVMEIKITNYSGTNDTMYLIIEKDNDLVTLKSLENISNYYYNKFKNKKIKEFFKEKILNKLQERL